MKFGSLFSGIGGLDLGLELAGMECKWQVEIDEYCRRVLEKHRPNINRYEDVRDFPPQEGVAEVDLICGGFPCQDISQAGTRLGLSGRRSGLWFEFFRIICEIRPRYVVLENVSALRIRGMDVVLGDLARIGYCSEWQSLRASFFRRPHRRERVFIVSYPDEFNEPEGVGNRQRTGKEIFARRSRERPSIRVETTATADRMDHGVSGTLYRRGVGGLGNAVVPQVAEWIGQQILICEGQR